MSSAAPDPRRKGRGPALLLAALCSVSAVAQEVPLASEEDFYGEIAVVVTATRLHQPLNHTPAAVTVIDREMIEARLAVYLVDEGDWYLDGDLVEDYSRIDERIAKGFRASGLDGKLELLVQNLGSEYQEFSTLNRFDTRVMLHGGPHFH